MWRICGSVALRTTVQRSLTLTVPNHVALFLKKQRFVSGVGSPGRIHTMDRILLDNSTTRFFIEYGGFLSNHMSHGIIALHRLGVSDDKLQHFVDWYEKKLDKAEQYPEENEPQGEDDLLGKRKGYYQILKQYEDSLDAIPGRDLDALLKQEFPKLSLGMVGSALHGLIHTGYGYAARNARLVCEGLAYLHYSYIPLTLSPQAPTSSSLGEGNMDILDVVKMFSEDKELLNFMYSAILEDGAIVKNHGKFQPRVAALLLQRGDDLARYVHQIKCPVSLKPDDLIKGDNLTSLLKWIVDCAIIVYLLADRVNDFFLLHGVTSAWSLYNILPVLSDNHAHIVDAVRTYLCVLLAAYAAEENPTLRMEILNNTPSLSWKEIVEKTVEADYDEHIYKLVQVCRDMSSVNTDPAMENVYRLAATSAACNELAFITGVIRK